MFVKRFVLGILLGAACMGFVACEEEAQPPEEEQPAAQPAPTEQPAEPVAEPAQPGAADVCKEMVEAAKAKDDAKLATLMTQPSAAALAGEGVKDALMTTLGGGECGEAVVAEDGAKATVPLKVGEESRELSFVKTEQGAWRFDGAAYVEKYPVQKAQAKGKNAKKAKKAKKVKKKK